MQPSKPSDVPGAWPAALTSALLIAQQVAGKAARDALFLSSFRTSLLPVVMALGAVLSLGAVYWLSRLMVRRAPASILLVLLGTSAVGYLSEWALSAWSPTSTALLVYFHTALFGPLLLSAFWSLINERFDPHTAKAAVARIAGGGTLGGVLGGLVVWRAASMVQPVVVLLLLATLNAAALLGTVLTRARGAGPERAVPTPAEADISPFGVLHEAPFLQNLALLVALGTATSAILDYVFSTQAVATFGRGQGLLSFFALFWLGVAVLSSLLQLSFGRLALERLGLAESIAVMPAAIIVGSALRLLVPGLASAAGLRGIEAIQRNTLYRAGYELLYTPIREERKRATKLLIDVGCDRIGTVLGSAIVVLTFSFFARGGASLLIAFVLALAVASLFVTRQLHVGYLKALAQGLRDGAAKLDLPPDESIARTSAAPEREQLIERIEALQPGGLSVLLGAKTQAQAEAPAPATVSATSSPEAALATARDLLSTDPASVQSALGKLQARGPEVSCAILLLAHAELHEPARRALSGLATLIPGQLLDALLDPTTDFHVRRRIPRILLYCSSPRATQGLLAGLADPRFEVRYECGRALLALTAGAASVIAEDAALIAIRREVEEHQRLLENASPAFEFDDEQNGSAQSPLVDGLLRDRVDRSLEHVFTLLSLHLEREPLRMAVRALHQEDARHRGTALEYLNTVLPVAIKELVWPLLGGSAPLPSVRGAAELLAEMAETAPGVGSVGNDGVTA